MADPRTVGGPPAAGPPDASRMIPAAALEWGQTPFDNLDRGELLRLVQAYHSALGSCRSVLAMAKEMQPDAPFWGEEGSGGHALAKADALVDLAGSGEDAAGQIFRAFFRYADQLLFPDLEPGAMGRWCINDQGEMWKPGNPGDRPLEWADLLPRTAA